MEQDKRKKITLEDAVSIILLYERTFSVVSGKIIDGADEFVVNHDLFCKFVDPQYIIDDADDHTKWSGKSKAASNLYQAVLDIRQNFVTLGQIRQTIDALLEDIHAMKCGELIRIINHIGKRMKKDAVRCRRERKKYIAELQLAGILIMQICQS